MKTENLLKKYPELIKKCREWDCSYSEAIEKIELQKKHQDLRFYQ